MTRRNASVASRRPDPLPQRRRGGVCSPSRKPGPRPQPSSIIRPSIDIPDPEFSSTASGLRPQRPEAHLVTSVAEIADSMATPVCKIPPAGRPLDGSSLASSARLRAVPWVGRRRPRAPTWARRWLAFGTTYKLVRPTRYTPTGPSQCCRQPQPVGCQIEVSVVSLSNSGCCRRVAKPSAPTRARASPSVPASRMLSGSRSRKPR